MDEVIHTKASSCAGLTPDVLPEAESHTAADSSQTGVSTRSMPSPTTPTIRRAENQLKWFVIKTTYGREQKGNDYLAEKGITTFYPTVRKIKEIRGIRKNITESRLPNIFFAQSTERILTPFVQQNFEAPYLRFYCRYSNSADRPRRELVTVPQSQMHALMKICEIEDEDTRLCSGVIHKFEHGDRVRVIDGPFCGIEGRVARIYGQQRVGIIVGDVLTAMTSYVPSGYLEKIEEP